MLFITDYIPVTIYFTTLSLNQKTLSKIQTPIKTSYWYLQRKWLT